jgi:hypothetical protein
VPADVFLRTFTISFVEQDVVSDAKLIAEGLSISQTTHGFEYERTIPGPEGFFGEFFLGSSSVACQHKFFY